MRASWCGSGEWGWRWGALEGCEGIVVAGFGGVGGVEHLDVAVVASRIESAVSDGIFDGAIVFVLMGAVGISAVGGEGSDIAKQSCEFFGDDIPQLELAYTGCIDECSAVGQIEPLRSGGGMFSFLVVLADFLDWLVESEFDRIEDGGFADAALSDDDADASAGQSLEVFDAPALGGADHPDGVTHLGIVTQEWLEGAWVDEIAFVDADACVDLVLFSSSEDTIDEIGFEIGLSGAGDDEQLIDIGSHDVPSIFAGPAEFGSSRFDSEDPSLFRPMGFDLDAVAGDNDVSLLGGEVFEDSSHSAAEDASIVGLCNGLEAVNSEDGSCERAVATSDLVSDGAVSCQIAFAADALRADGIDFIAGFVVFLGKVASSGLPLMSFSKLESMFVGFLGGHQ